MENASKALIMAGGILIALLIIGLLVLMFTSLQDYRNSEEQSTKDTQVAKFNDQFEPYKKDDLTLMELKSVYNKIESNNKKYPEYEIKNNIASVYPDINKDFKSIPEEDKINGKFKCIKTEYKNIDGRISLMNFEKVN